MVKKNRQYRLPSYQEVNDSEKGTSVKLPSYDEVSQSEAPVKKKDSGFPLLYERQKTSSIPSNLNLIIPSDVAGRVKEIGHPIVSIFNGTTAIPGVKIDEPELSDEEKQKQIEDPLKAIMTPVKQSLEQRQKEYDQQQKIRINTPSSSTAQKYLSPLHQAMRQDEDYTSQNAKDLIPKLQGELEKNLIPEAKTATDVLVTFGKNKGVEIPLKEDGTADVSKIDIDKLGKDNHTVSALVNRVREYDETVKDVKETGSIIDAAVKWYRRNNPHLDKTISAISQGTGTLNNQINIPPELLGRIVHQYIESNPNLQLAVGDQGLPADQLKQLKGENVFKIFPEYGLNVIKNEISRERQKEGGNNWFANPVFNNSKYLDNLADRLYKDDPIKKELVDKYLKGQWEGKIDTPGVIDELGVGMKGAAQGWHGTVNDVLGMGDSESDRLYKELRKESNSVSSGIGGFQKVLGQAANFSGMLATMAAGGGMMRAAGLSPLATNAILTAGTFYDDELNKWTAKYPGEQGKAKSGAIISTLAYMFANKLLPSSKLADAVAGKMGSEIPDALKILEEKGITKDATKQLANRFGSILKEAGKNTGKATAEMMGITTFQMALDKAFGLDDETFKKYHPNNELMDVAKSMIIGTAFPNFLIATGNRNGAERSLNEIGSDPQRFTDILNQEAQQNQEVSKDLQNKLADIQFLSDAKKDLTEMGISEKNQGRYLLEAMAERHSPKSENGDSNLKKQKNEQIKEHQEIKDRILKGENADEIVTESQQKKIDESDQAKTEVERLGKAKELDNKEIDVRIKDLDKESSTYSVQKEKLEQKRKEKNEDYDKKISEHEKLIIEEPKKEEKKSSIKVLTPEENKPVTETIPLIKTEQNAGAIREDQGRIPIEGKFPEGSQNNRSEDIQRSAEEAGQQSASTDTQRFPEEESKNNGETPPISEPPIGTRIHFEPPATQLSHRGLQNIANEFSLPDVKTRDRKSDLQLRTDAERTANEWAGNGEYGNNIEGLIQKAENGDVLTDEQRVILEQHLANVSNELRVIDPKSPEFDIKLSEIKRLKDAGEKTRSEAGAALRIPIGGSRSHPIADLADAMVAKMEANSVETLTENQKYEIEQKVSQYEARAISAEQKVSEMEAKMSEMEADKEFKSTVSKTKRVKKDFATTRKGLRDQLKAATKEHRDYLKDQGIQTMGVGFTFKEARIIAELVKTYVEEGITKLADVVDKVFEDVKDIVPGRDKKDILDVIAGVYNEPRKTKNELATTLNSLNIEAKLINKLESLLKGEEPRGERSKIERNQQIKELKEKIKSIKKEDREGSKFFIENIDDDAKKLAELRDRNEKKADEIREKISKGDFEAKTKPKSIFDNPELHKKYPILYRQVLDAIKDVENAKHEYDIELLRDQHRNENIVQKGGRAVKMAIATTKAVKSGIDDSGVFVQNIIAMVAHPVSGAKAFASHLDHFFSQKRFDRWLTQLHNNKPVWDLIQKSGLQVTEPSSLKQSQREEAFSNNLLDKSFKIGDKSYNIGKYTTKPFERLFTTIGNAMRVNMFLRMADKWNAEGKTFETNPEDYKSLATMLNTETGRGKLHQNVERASELITAGIWSPRLMASRFNILGLSDISSPVTGKGYYAGLSPKVRAMAAADVAKFIGTGISLMVLASAMGGKSDFDPESVTFGTVKIGNYTISVFDGFNKYVKTIVQTISGRKRKDGKLETAKRGETFFKFWRSSTTPAAGVAIDIGTGKDYMGKPVTVEGELVNLAAPMAATGMIDPIKRDGMVGLLPGLANFFGLNITDERDFGKDSSPAPSKKGHKPTKAHKAIKKD